MQNERCDEVIELGAVSAETKGTGQVREEERDFLI